MAAERDWWLKVAGEADRDLELFLSNQVANQIRSGVYSAHDAAYISKVTLNPVEGALKISDRELEKLRRLCQLWDVDLRVRNITSHRRIVGPFIVAAKKLCYPVLKALLKDFFRQQRAFNAAVISYLAEQNNHIHFAGFEESRKMDV